jgi:cell fate regulator YaaT (PSP1 superfamily)
MNQQPSKEKQPETPEKKHETRPHDYYKVRFRHAEHDFSAATRLQKLHKNEVVMVQTEHGLEPARVLCSAPEWPESKQQKQGQQLTIARRSTRDEVAKFEKLGDMEKKAFSLCLEQIKALQLPMNLVKVERFFSGGKIIFYFTAENRVDFRELVKILVQEFRTRVEMRQIGVRHETKMLGGLGCCGRELCCSSFIQNFESVSIKMAKEQNLPLNPAKISGACNRLLCCLNYEFDTYKSIRKSMPKIGKKITVNDQQYRVRRHNVLQESILVTDADDTEITLSKEEWQAAFSAPATKEK